MVTGTFNKHNLNISPSADVRSNDKEISLFFSMGSKFWFSMIVQFFDRILLSLTVISCDSGHFQDCFVWVVVPSSWPFNLDKKSRAFVIKELKGSGLGCL